MTQHKVATGLILWYLKTFKFVAWTSLWDTIYYIDSDRMANRCLREHELTHIKQMKDNGKFKFTVKYAYYSLRYGYRKNPFEIEAYKVQDDCVKGKI